MKVLIVNAPSRLGVYGALSSLAAIEPPVWAGLLAARLKRRGHFVQLLDCEVEGLSVEKAAEIINSEYPDLAVFTVYGQQPSASTQCLPAAEAVARRCDVRTLCLGTHPSALPERTLREGPWDYVAAGEGVQTVLELLSTMDGMGDRKDVPGLYWRENTAIYHGPAAANTENLNAELGEHGYEFFDFSRYRAHNWHAFGWPSRSPYASVQTSLSCPFKCNFCCIAAPFGGPGKGYRLWSPQNVVSRFERVEARGVFHVKIPDEMFLLNPVHVGAICEGLIQRFGPEPRFNIWAYARVDTCKDERLLAKMKRAGFNWLGIGIESGSKHVRDGMAKGTFGELEIVTAVKKVQAQEIAVGANYIFGLPDDTRETMQTTLDLACELNTEWANFYSAMAYPGSALHTTARQRGWQLPEDAGGPGWIGYSQHAYETLPLPTETLSAAEVLAFRDGAFTRYFSRSEYQSMLGHKFGVDAVTQINTMLGTGLSRHLLDRGYA